ncbi:hypothetical protein SNK03_008400 [Fusarium graminearum]|uniref:Uncharacterized protein n=1 Tax=Gibberella zeae TaxID=5518 RepID=A0A2H3HTK8_GIBZA|nr:hypothetical protein FG05_07064 [Fusarium graminearum]KAI6766694.1 hypothetical protein HG531_011916 [Fusarium graminearum]PCD40472.1 hypothetical protein FGRA07_01743 [Fusarium graminearum]CAF3442259.1 unnamed protein product [Fusarium graminearum]CAG1971870.1 unnamed protein product [Fusarium graminearum]
MDASVTDVRRSSIEKMPIPPTPPFDSLPDEIIEQILQLADPNAFASLVLLNRKWRAVSQRAHLYRHQLSTCPSYSASHSTLPPCDDDKLPELRRLFAREVKRNLFEAYLRPKETTFKLISTSISSSSCPGGEGMQYSTSPKGHHLLAYNSGRIYVIDLRGDGLEVKREFKILRRPVAACINDKGTLLAVLSTEMQVDLYDLQQSPPKRAQSIILDNTPRTIALSPCGSVLAAAYEGGIEVSSLRPEAMSTDRRAVKCDAVDALSFSFDGTQILGTTIHSAPPSTVIITAPYYDPGPHMSEDNLSPLWTTSILFPNTSRDCSHAVLLQDGNEEEASWTFTYDQSFETFRAVRIDDLRNGTTYFTGPVPGASSQASLIPSTLPATTYRGDLVSVGFQGKEVWIYGVPEDLDAIPDNSSLSNDGSSSGLGRQNSDRSGNSRRASTRARDTEGGRVPKWQILCDKLRNTFVSGFKAAEVTDVKTVKWVADYGSSSTQERLVITARGVGGPRLVTEEEDMDFVDGGRVTVSDFDYGISNGAKSEVIIEVGTDHPEVLEEEQRDLATEVAIVRRRTVAQKRGGRGGSTLLRAATSASRPPRVTLNVPEGPSSPQMTQNEHHDDDDDDDPLLPRRLGLPLTQPTRRRVVEPESPDDGEDGPTIEQMEALDAPYAHASPRSQTTLRRAATAAAVDRSLHPRTADGRRIEYRRADGRREHPHESDADNWVPPPPPYQKDDPGPDLPAFMRGPSVAPIGLGGASAPAPIPVPPMPALSTQTTNESSGNAQSVDSKSGNQSQRLPAHPAVSEPSAVSQPQAIPTPQTNTNPPPTQGEDADLYDVTPPASPRQPMVQPAGETSEARARQTSISSAVSAITSTSRAVVPPVDSTNEDGSPSPLQTPLQTDISAHDHFGPGPRVPAVNVEPASSAASVAQSGTDLAPRVRRLSNAQTWPRVTGPEPDPIVNPADGFPFPMSAPAEQSIQDESISGLPPLPSSSQLASLSKRVSQGNPRRFSGGFQVPRRPVGSFDGSGYTSNSMPDSMSAGPSGPGHLEPDQPLIISTPRGVSGAFDLPGRQTSGRRNEPPLLAPIPRHPRPIPGSNQRPTVERLETIYSIASSHGGNPPVLPLPLPNQQVPAWLNAPPVPVTRTSPTVNRRPSRAERSAAKNIMDAKKRGWTAKHKKQKKKKKAADAASSAGWTDISIGSGEKEKEKEKDRKCIVM